MLCENLVLYGRGCVWILGTGKLLVYWDTLQLQSQARARVPQGRVESVVLVNHTYSQTPL